MYEESMRHGSDPWPSLGPPSDPAGGLLSPVTGALIGRIADVGASAADSSSAAQAVLEAVSLALEPGAGDVTLAGHDETGELWLVPSAHIGTHTQLLQDGPPIAVDSTYEAAGVFRDRAPHYISETYGDADESDVNGPGRWRSAIAFRSSAALPLMLGTECIGTLTLHWAEPHEFDDSLRHTLETVAKVAALAITHAGARAYERPPNAEAEAAGEPGVEDESAEEPPMPAMVIATPRQSADTGVARFEVTSHGAIVPRPPGDQWSGREALRILINDRSTEDSWVLYDVFVPAKDTCACVAIRMPEAEDTLPDATDALLGLARTSLAHDAGVEGTLHALDDAARSMLPRDAAPDAWVALFDQEAGSLEWGSVGLAEMKQRGGDGREWHEVRDAEDDLAVHVGGMRIVMQGDHLVARIGNEVDVHVTRVR
jgi:hypothetical protein